ncbi:MAG: hypothetical protein O3B83_06365, partial [Bacteroidetes bacterium]|nr:hypothetical protein [Bacteroidota bacterium]
GGIIPDIFVPLDTTHASDYYSSVIRKGTMNSFILEYTNDHRKTLLKEYPLVKDFLENYALDESMMKQLFDAAEKDEISYDEEGYQTSKLWFDTRVKALLARNLYDSEAFYEVINPILPVYQRALEAMGDGSFERMNLAQAK